MSLMDLFHFYEDNVTNDPAIDEARSDVEAIVDRLLESAWSDGRASAITELMDMHGEECDE